MRRRLALIAASAALAAVSPALAFVDSSDYDAVGELLAVRQATGATASAVPGTTTAMGPGFIGTTVDAATWNREVTDFCTAQLATLDGASNPSGAAICYNIPLLNNVTGRFTADLRLFKISDPTGDFAGIAPQDIQVGLMYSGASVSLVNDNTTMTATGTAAAPPAPAATSLMARNIEVEMAGPPMGRVVRRTSNPQLLRTYLFVGQIDQTKMTGSMEVPNIEALVIPTLTLSATAPDGKVSTTNVSPNEAAFLVGAFSNMTFDSVTSLALRRVEDQLALLHAGEIAFVLPGVQILIFPIGLVITGSWLVLGVAAYGFGTYQRYNYAHSFRSRQAAVMRSTKNTF